MMPRSTLTKDRDIELLYYLKVDSEVVLQTNNRSVWSLLNNHGVDWISCIECFAGVGGDLYLDQQRSHAVV
jgi:hypothetical protein